MRKLQDLQSADHAASWVEHRGAILAATARYIVAAKTALGALQEVRRLRDVAAGAGHYWNAQGLPTPSDRLTEDNIDVLETMMDAETTVTAPARATAVEPVSSARRDLRLISIDDSVRGNHSAMVADLGATAGELVME